MSREFSKTIRFDFPRIPIVGTVMLLILVLNLPEMAFYILDGEKKPIVGVIATFVIGLGTAGITVSQLVAVGFFDILFPIKRALMINRGDVKTSYEWFYHIQDEASPVERAQVRPGQHDLDCREDIKQLNHKQIHATLHALELECREVNPSFGVQLEYYYSMYIVFFVTAMFCSVLLMLAAASHYFGYFTLEFSNVGILIDFLLLGGGLGGAYRARKIKEYLRITLFNHDRKHVLALLGKWYQCHFGASLSAPTQTF